MNFKPKYIAFTIFLFASLIWAYAQAPIIEGRYIDSLTKIVLLNKGDTIEAEAYKKLGNEYKITGDFTKAIDNEKKCIELYHNLNHQRGEGNGYNNLGLIYADLGNYAEATKCYFEAIKLYENSKHRLGLSLAYNNLAIIYDIQGNYNESLELHNKSLLLKKELKNAYGVATSYNNIGIIYKKLASYDKALKNYYDALNIFEEIHETQGIAYTTENISIVNVIVASIEQTKGNNKGADSLFNVAIIMQREALKLKMEMEDNNGVIIGHLNLGTLYAKRTLYDSAHFYLNKALTQSLATKTKDLTSDAYRDLSSLDSKIGDYKSAYQNHVLYLAYKDSVFNDESKQTLMRSKMQYEYEKKEINLVAEKKQKQLTIYVILGIMLFALSTLLMLYYRYVNIKKQKVIVELQKQKSEEELSKVDLENTKLKLFNQEAQYKLLQDQINPHFLFNTLETVNSLISNTPDLAKEFVYYLSDFLRINIQNNERLVLLKEEITLLNSYKEIQAIRFGDAIEIKIEINEQVLQQLKTPYFSLLTLVENALKHNSFTNEKPLVILIECENDYIQVSNNIQHKKLIGTSSKTGLTNLKERYKIIVNKEVIITSDENFFIVKLPYITI